jgi:hypothetical protein
LSLFTSCQTCCQFLWITHSWLPLQFSLMFSTKHLYGSIHISHIYVNPLLLETEVGD